MSKNFCGPFLVSAFEVIALGLGNIYETIKDTHFKKIENIIKEKVWGAPTFLASTGQRVTQRLPRTISRGRQLFKKLWQL